MDLKQKYIINLTSIELANISELAHQRNDPKEQRGVHSNKYYEGRSEFQTHFDGLKAEFVVGKHYQIPIYTNFSWTGDDGWDLVLPNVGTTECRYRRKAWYEFALNGDCLDEFIANIGILIIQGESNNSFVLKGWMHKKDFVNYNRRDNFGYGPRLVYPNNKLRSMNELDRLVWPGEF